MVDEQPIEEPPPGDASAPTPKRKRRHRAHTAAETAPELAPEPAPTPVRRGPSPWLVGALILIVLVLAAGIGVGAALLVPGIADADPPGATLPPPIATPTVPPLPTPTASATPTPSPNPLPSPSPRVHVVRKGENLTQIATRYGVTVAAIAAANGIADPNLIEPGQVLVIPNP